MVDFRISDLVKNPDGTDVSPLRRITVKSGDPFSQIPSPHLHAGALGIFSDLLSSVQMLKRE